MAGSTSPAARARKKTVTPVAWPSWAVLLAPAAAGSFTSGLLVSALPLFLFDQGIALGHVAGLFSLLAVAGVGVALAAGRHAAALARPSALLLLLGLQVAVFPAYLLVRGPYTLLLLSALATVLGAASAPAVQLLVATSTDPAARASAYARLGVAVSVSYGLALVAASALLAIGFHAVFLAGSLVALLAWTLAAALLGLQAARREPARHALQQACGVLEGSLAGLRRALAAARPAPVPTPSRRNARRMALHTLLFSAGLGAYPIYLPLFLLSLGLDLPWIGLAMASSWFIFGLVQPVGSWLVRRVGHLQPIIVGSLAVAAALNVGLAAAPLWGVLAAWAALGVADGIGRPLTQAWLTQAVAPQDWGHAMGLGLAATTAARTVTPALFALLLHEQGIRSAFLATAVLTALAVWPLRRLAPLAPPAAATAPTVSPAGGAP